MASISGTTRSICSSKLTAGPCPNGTPPTSTISAPSRTAAIAAPRALSKANVAPWSKKESGVRLTIAITATSREKSKMRAPMRRRASKTSRCALRSTSLTDSSAGCDIRLSLQTSFTPRPPFDFALTARVLRRSPRNLIDRVDEDGTWSRAVVLSRGPALLSGKQRGARVTFEAAPARVHDRRAIRALVTRLFPLEPDLAPFWHRVRHERGFAELARRCAGLRPQRFPTLFEALANGICCQQLSLAAGMTRLGHLAERFGARTPDGTRAGPPEPERVAGASLPALRQAG